MLFSVRLRLDPAPVDLLLVRSFVTAQLLLLLLL